VLLVLQLVSLCRNGITFRLARRDVLTAALLKILSRQRHDAVSPGERFPMFAKDYHAVIFGVERFFFDCLTLMRKAL
jgi:hypothetical protein